MTATVDFDTTDTSAVPAAQPRRAGESPRPGVPVPHPGRTWIRAGQRPERAARSTIRRARRIVSGAVLALVALAAITAAIVVVALRLTFAPVLSPSMEPEFGPGGLLVTRAMPADEIKVGDVLVLPIPENGSLTAATSVGATAEAGDRYVHRVVSVTQRDGRPVVKTKGDNNSAADPWLLRIDSPDVPTVVAHVPDLGKLSLVTQAAWIRVALIAMVAFFALVGIKRGLLDR